MRIPHSSTDVTRSPTSTPNAPRDRRADGRLARVLVAPVVLQAPSLEARQEDGGRVLPRAHVADGAGTLAVAGEARVGERVERHPLRAAREQRLRDAGPPHRRLDRPDVGVLARVAARHDRDLGRRKVERLDAPRLEQRDERERLHRRPEVHDGLRVAERAHDGALAVDFDDVSAVPALDDLAATLLDEDRRRQSRPRGTAGCGGGWTSSSGRGATVAGMGRAYGADRGRPADRGARASAVRPTRPARSNRSVGAPCPVLACGRIPRCPPVVRCAPVPDPADPGTIFRPDPDRWPSFYVSRHPAVRHKLAILRDEDTEPKKFREVVRELSWLLGYEALADVATRPIEIRTPIEPMEADELAVRIGLVPILRAGLGHGGRHARAHAHRAGLAPGALPRRADAAAGRVLQQAAGLRDGGPLTHPGPDARDRRLRDAPPSRCSSGGARRGSSS